MVEVSFFPATTDGYIDEIVTVFLEIGDWFKLIQNATFFTVNALFRPEDPSEAIPRPESTATNKLQAEGTAEESNVFLGWKVNTRLFRISLPHKKTTEWRCEILHILSLATTRKYDLYILIDMINQEAHIIHQSLYFLNRLRNLLILCKFFGPKPIPTPVLRGLALWDRLLERMIS